MRSSPAGPTRPWSTKTCPTKTCPTKTCPTKTCPTKTCPTKTLALGAVLGVGLLVVPAAAQSPPAGGTGPRAGRQAVSARFESAPQVGDTLPDLTLYDPDGKEVRLLEALAGHTTVLILGCLT